MQGISRSLQFPLEHTSVYMNEWMPHNSNNKMKLCCSFNLFGCIFNTKWNANCALRQQRRHPTIQLVNNLFFVLIQLFCVIIYLYYIWKKKFHRKIIIALTFGAMRAHSNWAVFYRNKNANENRFPCEWIKFRAQNDVLWV